ncbi:MAG: hypothetical protein IMZ62_02825 [Chloroflexi bacterium]|nr:hypothetical protein [Chloroflexota bacterium]
MSDRAGVCNTVWPVVMVRAADLEVGDVFFEDGELYRVLEIGPSEPGELTEYDLSMLKGEMLERAKERVAEPGVTCSAEELVEVQAVDGSWGIYDAGEALKSGGWEWSPDTRVVRVRRHVVSQGCEPGCQQAE